MQVYMGRKWVRGYQGLGERNGSYCLMVAEFVWANKKVLEKDRGDDYTAL